LFTDIVGYSKFSINEQRAVVDELTQVVHALEQFQRSETAGRLIKIPTATEWHWFFASPEAAAQYAIDSAVAGSGGRFGEREVKIRQEV